MYLVRSSWRRWEVTAGLALMLCALFVIPALAGAAAPPPPPPPPPPPGSPLILRQSVISGTSSFGAYGPVGPGCSSTTGGPDCTFATSNSTGNGNASPGGSFTDTTSATILLGPGPGSQLFPNGSVDSTGSPAGYCAEFVGTSHDVYATGGTIDTNSRGYTCCSSSSCPNGLGPPSTNFATTVCVSGTGIFAGIQCSGEGSNSSSDDVHFLGGGETFSTK